MHDKYTDYKARRILETLSPADRVAIAKGGVGEFSFRSGTYASSKTLARLQVLCESWYVSERRNVS